MFQCPIQYINSRQGDAFDELVMIQHNASLHGWWRRYKRRCNLAEDFYLKPLTLIYEEGRHWQSSEPLMPQVGTSAARGTVTALATPGFSEGVRGGEAPAAEAPSRDNDSTPTAGGAALAATGYAHAVRGAESTAAGEPARVVGGGGMGAPHTAHPTNGTHATRMSWRVASATSIPESLLLKH